MIIKVLIYSDWNSSSADKCKLLLSAKSKVESTAAQNMVKYFKGLTFRNLAEHHYGVNFTLFHLLKQ